MSNFYEEKNAKMIKRRQEYKYSLPKMVLSAEHLDHCKLLPNREALLQTIPKSATVAEIGVYKGDYSEKIWQVAKPEKFYLIDMWEADRFASGRDTVEEMFKEEIEQNTVELMVGRSVDMIAQLPDASMDWIYVDSDHSYQTTIDELRASESKMKAGGRIAGHDFSQGNVITPVPYGVIEAVHEFCVTNHWRYCYLTLESGDNFSFCIEKIED